MRIVFVLLIALLPFKWNGWTSKSTKYNPAQSYTIEYWDATSGITLDATSDSVTSWLGQKNGITLTSTIGSYPLYYSQSIGISDVDLNWIGYNDSRLNFGTESFTLSFCGYIKSLSVINTMIAKMIGTTASGYRFYVNSTVLRVDIRGNGNSLDVKADGFTPSAKSNIIATVAVDRQTNSVKFFVNGTKYGAIYIANTLQPTDDISATTSNFFIGRYGASTTYYFDGRVNAVRVDKGYLSDNDIKKLHEYWNEKFGIY